MLANYQPLSNFPFFSQVLEKTVTVQLCDYLHRNNLFEEFQSGLRVLAQMMHLLWPTYRKEWRPFTGPDPVCQSWSTHGPALGQLRTHCSATMNVLCKFEIRTVGARWSSYPFENTLKVIILPVWSKILVLTTQSKRVHAESLFPVILHDGEYWSTDNNT